MQNGIDMAPNKSQIDTWESHCKDYSADRRGLEADAEVDLVSFNDQLTKASKTPLTIKPTALTVPASCAFAPASGAGRGGRGGGGR